MRNLTIKRKKSFIGCLSRAKIYIEDAKAPELTINNTPCRKLGELKNGEEKTFVIDNFAAKVFVIADKLTKEFCNDCYQLPTGRQDICLSGKMKFNVVAANAFRFDDNNDPQALAIRKRAAKRGWLVILVAAIVGAAVGYFLGYTVLQPDNTVSPKNFFGAGMYITLTEEFAKTNYDGLTVAFESEDVGVFALKEPFTLAEGFEDNSLEEYANMIINANNLTASPVTNQDGLVGYYYDFLDTETDLTYRYYTYVYKSEDAFWMVQFAILKEDVHEYAHQIRNWAKSAYFVSAPET